MWSKVNKDFSHDRLDLNTFKARLQGAEGVTHRKQQTPTERHSGTRFPTLMKSVARAMSSYNEETKMSNPDVTVYEA